MVFRRLVIAVAVFTIFTAGAMTAYQVADLGQNAAAKTLQEETNQTVIIEHDNYQYVNTDQFTAGFGNNTTAYYNGSELTRNTEYFWNQSDGTILFNDSVGTEGETANLTYEYYQNTQEVQELAGPLDTVTEAIGRTGLFAAGISIIIVILFFGGFVVNRFTGNDLPGSNR